MESKIPNKNLLFAALSGYAIFAFFAWKNSVLGYVPDIAVFAILAFAFYKYADYWNLDNFTYGFFVFSLMPHAAGVFGFYGASPIGLQWDHVTHFFPMAAVSMMLYKTFGKLVDKGFFAKHKFAIYLVIILASMGVGSLIEIVEYAGFNNFGFGEGALFWGTGDGDPTLAVIASDIDNYGGGWANTAKDIIWNGYGALAGLIVAKIRNRRR